MDYYEEDPSIANEVSETEIFINRPVSEVWRQFLDLSSWITSHNIEEVSEPRRVVGAVTRVSFRRAKEMGYATPHHHYCKIIRLVPERRYVLKTYSEKGGSYGAQIVGFDDAHFYAQDAGTRLTFGYFGEHRSGHVADEAAAIDMDASDEGMKINLDNLKRIVEGR